MRPERLRLEGFTVFRDPVEIDFSDADLFVLVGPTGSGKSSIIDAITFALYGSIPRLKKGRVEPIVSLGAQRARIRFDFSVSGTPYTAVRVVQRTKTGATTSEARLEGGGTEIVGAAELTEAVERLLGLSYEHFTKSVVLPQGQFASFLLGGSSDRQALLRELLDLGRFGAVRDHAVQRAQASEARATALRSTLEQSEDVTADAVEHLEASVTSIATALEWSRTERERIGELKERLNESNRNFDQVTSSAKTLLAVERPAHLDEVDLRMRNAIETVANSKAELEKAMLLLDDARAVAADRGDAAQVARLLELAIRRRTLERQRTVLGESIAASDRSRASAEATLGRLGIDRVERVKTANALRTGHAAHALRAALESGDDCPVCHRTIDDESLVGTDPGSDAIAEAEASVADVDLAMESARSEMISHETRLRELREQVDRAGAEHADLVAALDGQSEADIRERQEGIVAAAVQIEAASSAVAAARSRLASGERDVERITTETVQFWQLLDSHRMSLTTLNPPPLERVDLGREWTEFLGWRDSRAAEVDEELRTVTLLRSQLTTEIETAVAAMANRVELSGVVVEPGQDPFDRALVAYTQTTERMERMRIDLAKKIESAAQVEGYESDAIVARALAMHLNVNGFERWLIEEVVRDLVLHANRRLDELSAGAYALAVEKSDFVVIDRLSADERRAPETLSGGETFLVSLALALSLAEQMSAISLSGAARLESIFLDEGFGTLDAETLETVAAVIHELGSDGRTVGLITHVQELARQMPVRFEVSKRSGSASVQRVES